MSQRDQQEQQKPDEPAPPPENLDPTRYTGRCKWFNVTKCFGFIILDGTQEDIFVHQSSIQMRGHRSLGEGERVSFNIGPGKKGGSAAYNVSAEFPGEELQGSSIHPPGKNTIRCYNCGKFGKHTAKKCPQPPSEQKVCYKCNSPDHLWATCPHNPLRPRSGGEDDANKPGTSASSADKPGTSGSSAKEK